MRKPSHYTVLIFFSVLSVLGLAIIPKLSIQLNPSKNVGNITVSYHWNNVSPEVIEHQISSKLEGAFSTLQGIQKLSSVSDYRNGYITIEADKSADLDQLRFEVATLVRQLYPQLPKEVSYPTISLNSPYEEMQQRPLMSLQLNGQAALTDLSVFAEEQLKPKLTSIKGIYNISVYGGNRQEWVLTYDRNQLEGLRLNENEIINAIKNHYQQSSLGLIRNGQGEQMNVVLSPASSTAFTQKSEDEIRHDLEKIELPLKDSQKLVRIVRLSDILKVSRNEQPTQTFYRMNGKNAVTLVIQADAAVNQLALSKSIRTKLDEINKLLPLTYRVNIEHDVTEYISENLNKIWVQSGLAILILLLFVWLSTSCSWRYTLVIFLALIVNLALSFIVFYFFKVEIHLYSLAAITTSLGILMDNTIVMVDHYRKYRNLIVFPALLGATLATIAGLSVIYFLPEETKLDLLDFALVMIITLVISLLTALFFVPALLERMSFIGNNHALVMRKNLRRTSRLSRLYEKIALFFLRFRKIFLLLALLSFGLPVFMLPEHLEETNPLANYYNPVIGSDFYQENLKPTINKILGGTLRLFVNFVYENSHYSTHEQTLLYVNAKLKSQATIEQMNELYLRLESYLSPFKEIDCFMTRIYSEEKGSMIIYFKPEYENGAFPYILKNELISFSNETSGVNWKIFGVGEGFRYSPNEVDNTCAFNVLMKGYNYHELERQALLFKKRLESNPRTKNVNSNNSLNLWNAKNHYEFALETDPRYLALAEQSKAEIYDYLQRQNIRPRADIYQMMTGAYEQIKVVPIDSKNFSIWSLMNQTVKVGKNSIKLSDFARSEKRRTSPEIHKENQEYLRMVSFDFLGDDKYGDKYLEKTLDAFKPSLPLGYTAAKVGYDWTLNEGQQHYWLIGLVMVLIYIICAIIFESLWQPLALIMLIPISFIGVFLTFYCFTFNFDQGGYASFVLLSGNVVCAAIFIIAEFNNLRKIYPAAHPFKLYIKAYNHKIIPILLTVFSTVAGLVPFLVYGQTEGFWFALGAGTIGGLIMSLLGIILYLPLFLKIPVNSLTR